MSPADDNNDDPWDVKGDTNKPKAPNKEEPTPFGRGKNSNQTPDFSKVVNEFQRRFKEKHGGGGGGSGGAIPPQFQGKIFGAIVGVLVLVWLGSGFYMVEEGSIAVVLRFGKFVRTANPGPRYRWPAPIEEEIVKKVTVENQIDSNTADSDIEHKLTLTGDENMVIPSYSITWKIKDIKNYLFKVRNPEETIKAAAESALRDAMGQTTAKQALTEGIAEIGANTKTILQKILDSYESGIEITRFQLQRIEPPAQVVEAFNDMQASKVDGDRLSNEAQSYSNDILPKARGQAESYLRAAEAYSAEIVAKAEGEASRFSQVYKSYKINPKITRIRLQRELMDQMLKQGNITIVDHDLSKSLQNYNQITPVPLLNKKEGA